MEPGAWATLTEDMENNIFEKLPYVELFRLQRVCKAFRGMISREGFQRTCALSERLQVSFSPLLFFLHDGTDLEWIGFDSTVQEWKRLPSLRALLPAPSRNTLMKNYFVTADGGLLCVNVSNDRDAERIIVCNPMTQTMKELPPMHFPRHPVLLHLVVNPATNDYTVIAAGSAYMGTHALSRKTEVYSSATGKWEVAGDIPGPDHGLNDYQTGAFNNGILFCRAFSEEDHSTFHAVLAYDVKKGEWLRSWRCPFPSSFFRYSRASNPQLLRCGGEVYLFWEETRDCPQTSHVCIAKLKYEADGKEGRWSDVVGIAREGSNGLLSYPEYSCSALHGSSSRLCVFNRIAHTAEVYDAHEDKDQQPVILPGPPPSRPSWKTFFFLNPMNFSFEPNFYVPV